MLFTKDRRPDSASGRFIDRDYGVLGYEWLHMLAVTRGILPAPAWEHYLALDPATTTTEPEYDPALFVAALTERVDLPRPGAPGALRLELTSSLLGPGQADDDAPAPRPPWRQGLRAADDRYRHVTVHAGRTRFTLHLEPVTPPGGWQLERNQHRLTAVRDGAVVHDEVLADSPLETSVRHAAAALFAEAAPPAPDLEPLRRIARLADVLRERAPDALTLMRPGPARSSTRPRPRRLPGRPEGPAVMNALSLTAGQGVVTIHSNTPGVTDWATRYFGRYWKASPPEESTAVTGPVVTVVDGDHRAPVVGSHTQHAVFAREPVG
ncbi:hypothetical protein ACFWRT_13685 [Streptomyces cyaneofuscatus]|uniref:hypothetical protein n=1 Tax=Streptomyces cyaneofuscatus TaxID=66883 RepID=UPI0036541BF9